MTKRFYLIVIVFIAVVALFCSGCTMSRVQMTDPQTTIEVKEGLTDGLEGLRKNIRHDLRICVGEFKDKTGKFQDADMLRYSLAVTQGPDDILYHLLYAAFGPKIIVERNAENFSRIVNEYKRSHRFNKEGKQVGLIQRYGPDGGITGAQYMITGAIVYYHVDRYSGGGGIEVQGYGVNFQKAITRVGITMRLVDMDNSEILWSRLVESWVSGTKVGVNLFRFVTHNQKEYFVQSEAGIAAQLPADYALRDCMASAIANMINEHEYLFVKKAKRSKYPSLGGADFLDETMEVKKGSELWKNGKTFTPKP